MAVREPKKLDRRQVRTKRRIREAFLDLMMEKPMEKITIKELAQRADIDRKTFYLHYGAISEVLAESQEELLQRILELVSEYDILQPSFDALSFFQALNHIIGCDSDFYRRVVIRDQYSFFYAKLRDSLKDALRQKYSHRLERSQFSQVKLDLYMEYAVSGIMAIYVESLKHPEYDLDEVAEAASEIAYGGGHMVLERI